MIYKIAIFSTSLNIISLQDFIKYEIYYFNTIDKKAIVDFKPHIIILNTTLFPLKYLEKIDSFIKEAKKILIVEKLELMMYLENYEYNVSSIIPVDFLQEGLNSACIKAVYEFNLENSPQMIHLKDDLVYQPKIGILNLKDSQVSFTAIQKRFFDFMLIKKNHIVSYEEIIYTVWNEKMVSQSTLKNMVSFFNKIYPNFIINHYGIGYKLNFQQNNTELNTKIKCLEILEKFVNDVFNFSIIDKLSIQNAITKVIEIFNADRICLCTPINLKYNYFYIEFYSFTEKFDPKVRERIKLEMTPSQKIIMKKLLTSDEPLYLDENTLMPIIMEEYVFIEKGHHPAKSVLVTHLKQKDGRDWAFAIHQCSFERKYTKIEIEIFKKISQKILILLEMYTAIDKNKLELDNLEKML